METGNLNHLGAELVVQILMIYSSSPQARRLASELITGDPFNIDIKLDMKSKNRNAEILNVYLKTLGLRLVFKRVPKKYNPPMLVSPMVFFDTPSKFEDPLMPIHPDEIIDMEADMKRLLDPPKLPMICSPMEFITDDKEAYMKANGIVDPYLEWLKEQDKKI